MKQILLVLLVLTAALGGFFVVRTLNEPVKKGPRPSVQPGPALPGGNRDQGPQAGPRAGAGPGAGSRRQFENVSWKPMASPDSVVHWNDRWQIDMSQVDFTAPVLLRIGDVEITQADYRRMVCLEAAKGYHLARFSEALAAHAARQRGNTTELTLELYEELIAFEAAEGGMGLQERVMNMAHTAMLPPELAKKAHRLTMAALVYNTLGGKTSELHPLLLQALTKVGAYGPAYETAPPEQVPFVSVRSLREVWHRLHSAEEYEERQLDLRKFSTLATSFGAYQQGVRNFDLGALTWTFLDAPMPEGIFMRVALADIDPDAETIAPWLLGAPVIDITVDEVWPFVADSINEDTRWSVLRSLTWYKVVGSELEKLGFMPDPAESAAAFVAYHKTQMGTMFDTVFTSAAEGYPTIHHYRAMRRLLEGFRRSLAPGWDSPEVQKPFYLRNRFFIERWNPMLDFAYYPALRWERSENGSVDWIVDWDAALRDATAAKGRVVLGQDFRVIAADQAKSLSTDIQRYFGEEYADEYQQRIRGGNISGSLFTVEGALGETPYSEILNGASVVKAIAAYEKINEVTEPIRIAGGYALARLTKAELTALETLWEDNRALGEHYYTLSEFLKWTNALLRDSAREFSKG